MNRRNRPRRPDAFTLVELLLVIAIIGILITLFLPVYTSIRTTIDRMHCQMNLTKCQQILLQYASNNNNWLPNFDAFNYKGNTLECGFVEPTSQSKTQFPMVNELKGYGASAAIFTCPSSAAAQDHSYWEYPNPNNVSVWSTWDSVSPQPEGNPPYGFVSTGNVKQVWTYGYAFFCRYCFTGQLVNWCMFLDGRQMPIKASDDGNLPLGADMIAYGAGFAAQGNYPASPGNGWYGMSHEPNAIQTENLAPVAGGLVTIGYPQTGGGNVVFLNGSCQWFDVGQLYSGISVTYSADIQPMYFGEYYTGANGGLGQVGNNPRDLAFPRQPNNTQYYFGDRPLSASSKLNN